MNDCSARILVIDGEATVRFMLAVMLRRQGYTVATAANGVDALTMLELHHYHLILVELKLPGTLSGLEIARHLHTERLDTAIQIFTGNTMAAPSLADSNDFDYMYKTASPQEVLDRVTTLLKQDAYMPSIREPRRAGEVVCR